MPNEIDRTQVVIETNIDNSKADKKVDDLERKLNDLENPRTLDLNTKFDIDKIIDSLDKKVKELYRVVDKNWSSNQPAANKAYSQARQLEWARGHINEDRGSLSKADLDDLLTSIGFKLDGDTISELAASGNNGSAQQVIQETKNAALEMQRLIQEYNALASAYKHRKDDNLSAADVASIKSKMDDIKAKLQELGAKTQDGYGSQSYKNAWEGYAEKQKEEDKESSGKGFNWARLGGAIIGIQSIFMFVKRIAAQNEKIGAAMNHLIGSLASALEPILNWLAVFINTIAAWLSKIFGTSRKTEKHTAAAAKQLAGFDEITNLGGGSGASTGAGDVKVGTFDWLEDLVKGLIQMINGLLEMIVGGLQVIYGLAESIILGITTGLATVVALVTSVGGGLFTGLYQGIAGFIDGLQNAFVNLVKNIINLVSGIFTSFIEGFQKAREDGKGIIASIFSGIWNSLKTTFSNLINTLKTLFNDLFKSFKAGLKGFWDGFKSGFSKVWGWWDTVVLTPLGKGVTTMYNKYVLPGIEHIINGWNNVKKGFEKFWNGLKGMINSALKIINKIPGVNIPLLATGGQVRQGQIFIAREAGPELVGTMNGRSTVMNNDQIVDSVSKGVENAIMRTMGANNGNQNINLFLDGKQIADVVVNNIRKQNRIMGGSVI